jgi:hypothetical protein
MFLTAKKTNKKPKPKSNPDIKNILDKNIKKLEPERIIEFPTITSYGNIKFDLNWISIRRKIQKFNIFKKILKETKETEDFKKHRDVKKFLYDLFIVKYEFDKVWETYTNWFNRVVNKHE